MAEEEQKGDRTNESLEQSHDEMQKQISLITTDREPMLRKG